MHGTAIFVAGAINPILLLLLLAAPFVGPREERIWRFWLVSAAGISIAVALAELGKALPIWAGHPEFPSGHATFAAATATRLVRRSLRLLWIAAPLCALLGWALVAAHYHRAVDVAAALLLGPSVTLLCAAMIEFFIPETERRGEESS